jgi:hypothetical protein
LFVVAGTRFWIGVASITEYMDVYFWDADLFCNLEELIKMILLGVLKDCQHDIIL